MTPTPVHAALERLRRAVPRKVLVHGVLAGVGTGLACWLVGVQGARPVLLGGCVTAVILVVTSAPASRYGPWPARPERPPSGGSSQVWRLANRLGSSRPSETDPALQYRLRRLATARLRRLGIDWSDPRAVRALGPQVHAALEADTFTTDLRHLDRVVTAIEELRTVDPGGNTP
ncbi:hypothetical protein [Jiangella gansuensis]|uniref:hypothetical protein n=1 Tax=Jiangella gansuensis TaxID=281473 RepID=UPI00047A4D2C|nr:hypothetical protein [Jiangella gansuensis]